MQVSIDDNRISTLQYYKNFKGLSGGNLPLTATSARTASGISGSYIDMFAIGDNDVVFVQAGDSSVNADSNFDYALKIGQPYRFPWNNYDYLAGVCPTGETATLYFNPVQ